MRYIGVLLFAVLLMPFKALAQEPLAKHVILISIDGMSSDAVDVVSKRKGSAVSLLLKEGAWTLNARTDNDYTVTLPNHTSMVTGRPVLGESGHGVVDNGMLSKTVHDYAGQKVMSVFDILRRYNRPSAMLASKPKFDVYQKSFPIDRVHITEYDDEKTMVNFEKLMSANPPSFLFMHLAGLDKVGHRYGWELALNSMYLKEFYVIDGYLKRILQLIKKNVKLKNDAIIIVTADHGGWLKGHGDSKDFHNYTVPFIIWGKAVAKGADLYRINDDTRKDPLTNRVSIKEEFQPIRNGDAANLTLSLLGLPPVEGSTIGFNKPLKTSKD